MSIVADTGPLIALAKVDQLGLLERLFSQVIITPAVHRELLAKAGPEAVQLDRALTTFIRIAERPLQPPEVMAATSHLGPGEQEVVALAHNMGLLLLIDDRQGRQAARHLKLLHVGVVGVVIRAKEAGLIPLVRPLLEQIRARGYWLADELLDAAAKL